MLEEGEVFMKSSERNLELPDGSFTDILLGDVLLARHPCKLPTDVRKVTFLQALWLVVSR